MPGTLSTPTRIRDTDIRHGTCVSHVSWCTPGLLTGRFLWSRWRGKRSRHFQRMRNPQFCVSGKRPIDGEATCPFMSSLSLQTRSCNEQRTQCHSCVYIDHKIPGVGLNYICIFIRLKTLMMFMSMQYAYISYVQAYLIYTGCVEIKIVAHIIRDTLISTRLIF